jgi:hypothetical protein
VIVVCLVANFRTKKLVLPILCVIQGTLSDHSLQPVESFPHVILRRSERESDPRFELGDAASTLTAIDVKEDPKHGHNFMFKPLMEKRRRDSKSELSSEYTSTLARYDQVSKANVKA